MTTIGVLNAVMRLDTREFTQAIALTKKETKEAARTMEEMRTPLEIYQDRTLSLRKALNAGAIDQASYGRAIAGARRELMQTDPILSRFTGLLSPMTVALGAVAAGAATATAAIAGLSAITLGGIDRLDTLADGAAALGMEAQVLQQLQAAAVLADAPVESLTSAIAKMLNVVASAHQGDTKGLEVFERLGLDARELIRLSPDKMFERIADSIRELPTTAQQFNAIKEVFGKGNFELRNLIVSFDEMNAKAKRFTIDNDAFGGPISDADMAMKELSLSMEHAKNIIAVELAPTVTAVADAMTKLSQADFRQSSLWQGVSGLSKLLSEVADKAAKLDSVLGGGGRAFDIAGTGLARTSSPLGAAMLEGGALLDRLLDRDQARQTGAPAITDEDREAMNLAAGEAEHDADKAFKAAEQAIKEFEKMFGKLDAGMVDTMRGVEVIEAKSREATKREQERKRFAEQMEQQALRAGLNERQLVEFEARQRGMSDAEVNRMLGLFDRTQRGREAMQEQRAGVAGPIKGSQEAAAAIARFQNQQREAVDIAEQQLDVMEEIRNGIERGAVIIEAVEL